MILFSLLIFEIYLFYAIIKRYKYSFISFSYIVFFLYAQSLYLDYIFFDKENFGLRAIPILKVSVESNIFLWTSISYAFFIIPYSFVLLYKYEKIKVENIVTYFEPVYKNILKFLLLIFILYLLVLIKKIYGLERYMVKEVTGNVLDSMTFATIIYFWIFLVYYMKTKSLIYYAFTLILITAMILVFERENIVILTMLLFYSYFKNLKIKSFLIGLVLGILLLAHIKAIIIASFVATDINDFIRIVQGHPFLFSEMDSLTSFLMISDFLKGDSSFYESYYLTYISHSFVHVFKVFLQFDFSTLAQQSTEYYTNNKMGTAFSLILESLINFWIFGPLIVGILLAWAFKKIYINWVPIYGSALNILLIVVSLKLIRTEFSIVLKLYILPMILAYFLFRFFFKRSIYR